MGSQAVCVLGDVARERYRQIEAHADVSAAVILELIDLPVRFLAAFAREYFKILQHRRVDRRETEAAKHAAGGFDQLFAGDHLGR